MHLRGSRGIIMLAAALNLTGVARGDDALPLVDRGDARQLRAHCRALLTSLDQLKAPLPAPTREALEKLVAGQGNEPADLIAIQKALDPHCLVGVTINPESRVKAARGPAAAMLTRAKRGVFLVKVQNDAGVTQPLAIDGPQLRSRERAGDRWLAAAFHREPPLTLKLTGREFEYLILICETSEAGKREAKLLFDVGQGTQDLGFRAEVPVLFTIKASE